AGGVPPAGLVVLAEHHADQRSVPGGPDLHGPPGPGGAAPRDARPRRPAPADPADDGPRLGAQARRGRGPAHRGEHEAGRGTAEGPARLDRGGAAESGARRATLTRRTGDASPRKRVAPPHGGSHTSRDTSLPVTPRNSSRDAVRVNRC